MLEQELAIIVIEDSPDDAELLLHALYAGGFTINAQIIDTAKELEDMLDQESWDVIISEYSMPRFDGLTALQIVKQRGLEIPFIMVSGQRGEEFAVEAMKAGAQDYIVKSNLARLCSSVQRELVEAQNRVTRKAAELNIQRQNERLRLVNDTARDLLSRLDLNEIFQMILERAARILGVDDGLILITDPKRAVFEVRAARGILTPQIGDQLTVPTGLMAAVIETKQPAIVEDYANWPKRNPQPILDQMKSALAVPLTIGKEVVGIIFFGSTDSAFKFSSGAEALLNEFASLASIAIDNARLYGKLQKELEEVKRSETQSCRYREIIERTKDIIIIVNSQGHIVDANRAALSNYGYTLEELRNLRGGLLRAPESNEELPQFIQAALVSHKQIETINRRKDGSCFPVEVATGLIELEDGPGFVSIIRDISARKQAEDELHRKMKLLSDALEQIKNTQARMIQQEKLAGIGQLAAGVAHEINNPLGFVISNFDSLQTYTHRFLEMIAAYKGFLQQAPSMNTGELSQGIIELQQLEKKKKIEFLTRDVENLFVESNDGLDRVARIVKGLRSFSRVDRQDVFAEYDLNEGVESTLVLARNEIKYHADVETELGNLPIISASGGQINQVLMNIVVNAAQAIKSADESERGVIRIKTFVTDNPFATGNQVGCSIYNNGPPIPPAIIDRIFEPFFTTKKVGQGTGLGLSISYDIISNIHHGQLSVVSTVEEGTTFTFLLPIKADMVNS